MLGSGFSILATIDPYSISLIPSSISNIRNGPECQVSENRLKAQGIGCTEKVSTKS
jgi:hypothetical protein